MKAVTMSVLFTLLCIFTMSASAESIKIVSSESEANLIIYRDKNRVLSNRVYLRFRVNGQYVGKLRIGESLFLRTAEKEQLISVNDPKRSRIMVRTGNHTQYISVSENDKRHLVLEQTRVSEWHAGVLP